MKFKADRLFDVWNFPSNRMASESESIEYVITVLPPHKAIVFSLLMVLTLDIVMFVSLLSLWESE